MHPQIPHFLISFYHNKPYINGNIIYSALCSRVTIYQTDRYLYTHTLSHHSPLCKSYSQISSFGVSFGSVRGFRARFASHLVQFGASERVSRVIWFSSGLQSALHTHIHTLSLSRTHARTHTHTLTTVRSVSHTARSRRLEGKLHDQPPTAEKHTPSSLYTQNTSHLPNSAFHNIESIGSVRGFRALDTHTHTHARPDFAELDVSLEQHFNSKI